MILEIVAAFPKLETHCRDSDTRGEFYLTDPGGKKPCYIIKTLITEVEKESYAKVSNPRQKIIHFIAVDKCLTQGLNMKSCECVLLDNLKLVFLELKLNVITDKQKNIDDTREGALFQIGKTIELFKTELAKTGRSFGNMAVVAQVALPPTSPKNNATYKLIKDNFASKYGYDYIDSREVVFN